MEKGFLMISLKKAGLLVLALMGYSASIYGQTQWIVRSPVLIKYTLKSIASDGKQFVGVGYLGEIATSTNGVAWANMPSGVTRNLNAVGCNDKLFVAVGDSGTILTSPEGRPGRKGSQIP